MLERPLRTNVWDWRWMKASDPSFAAVCLFSLLGIILSLVFIALDVVLAPTQLP